MPWSPMPKFPAICDDLRAEYGDRPFSIDELRPVVMSHTGLVRDESIKNAIRAMELTGWIKRTSDGSGWVLLKTGGSAPGAEDSSKRIAELTDELRKAKEMILSQEERIENLKNLLDDARQMWLSAEKKLEAEKGGDAGSLPEGKTYRDVPQPIEKEKEIINSVIDEKSS